jgi:hypothetical protein
MLISLYPVIPKETEPVLFSRYRMDVIIHVPFAQYLLQEEKAEVIVLKTL